MTGSGEKNNVCAMNEKRTDVEAKYTALGHCNISLGIYLDSLYSVHEKEVNLDIVSNYEPQDNPFDGRTFLHNGIKTRTISHKQWKPSRDDSYLLTGIAPTTKEKIFNFFHKNFDINEAQYVSLVHKSSIVSHGVEFEGPVYISSGGVVAQFARLGKFVSIQRNVIVEHHTQIGEYSSIFSGANIGPSCKIGKNVKINMGATILNGLEIGDNAEIGAGALVTKSVPSNTLVYGCPAKIIKMI